MAETITPDIDPITGAFIRAYGTPQQQAATGLTLPATAPPVGASGAPDEPAGSGVIGVDKRSDVERFADNVRARASNAEGAFKQALADHPALNYAVQTAPRQALSTAFGLPGALAGAALPSPSLPPATGSIRSPISFERTQPLAPTQPQTQNVPVASLPNAPAAPAVSPGLGPGGGAGLGTDRALQGAQKDVLAGQQALVDKKTEEAGAQLGALNFAADATSADAQMKAIFAAHQKAVDEGIAKEQDDYSRQIQDERDKASKLGVDPGRVFRKMDTGTKIMMIIGAVSSGALSGLTGQPNSFVPMMQQLIKDDMDSQNVAIDQAWKRVGGMQTTYENLVRRGMDRRVATNAYLGQIIDSTEQEMKARLAKAQLPAERANLEAAIQSLQNQRSGLDVQLQEYWKGVYDRRSAAASAAAAAAAERIFQHNVTLQKLRNETVTANATADKAARGEGSETRREQLRSYEAALDGLERMQQMIDAGGKLDAGRTAEGQSLVASTANALARAETGGKRAPSEAEMHLLEQQIPGDPNRYQWTRADLARINTTRTKVIRDMNRLREEEGLPPVPEDRAAGVGGVPGAVKAP